MNRRDFLRQALLTLPAATFVSGCVSSRQQAQTPKQYPWLAAQSVNARHEIRILQFTDIHFFHSINKAPKSEAYKRQKTQDGIKRLIDRSDPHLIVVTGDFWHENPDGRGAEFMDYAVGQAESWGLPWFYTWGNHDELTDYSVGHKRLASAKRSLYRGDNSEGNYALSINDRKGAPLAQFICINSNGDGMAESDRTWVKEQLPLLDTPGEAAPLRMAAMHIPIKQYSDIWENGVARGIIGEDACIEQENGSSLKVLRDAGVQAVICGHDHVNDYHGMDNGINLIYGRATGYSGYGHPAVPKGGKLYRLDPARKEIQWSSLLFEGGEWYPSENQRQNVRPKK